MARNGEEKPGDDARSPDSQINRPRPGLVREYWAFLGSIKKGWLMPIILVLLLLGLLIVLGGTALAPFMYPFF